MTKKKQENNHECQENSWLCPNCGNTWSFDEWQFKKCYNCGYPNQELMTINEFGYEDEDYDFDEEFEDPK